MVYIVVITHLHPFTNLQPKARQFKVDGNGDFQAFPI